MQIQYDKNPHQAEFHSDLESKFLHLSCGFGGGKSYSLAMKSFLLSYVNRGIRGGCVVNSIADFKKDLLPLIEDILAENRIRYRYHKSDKWFRFPWSRAAMYVASAEKSLRGPNWGWAVINEATLIPHMRYKETIGRVRVKGAPCPQIASSGTPEGTDHWAYEIFVEKPMRRSRIIYGDTRDNQKNLGEDYIPSLMDSYDAVMLDAYLRGLFVNMKANRFYYAYDPRKALNKALARIPGVPVYVSMDFNVDPMTAVCWHVLPVRSPSGGMLLDHQGQPVRRALAFDEVTLSGGEGADTRKMAQALKSRGYHPDDVVIYPDPAGKARSTQGPSDVLILKDEGFQQIRTRNVAPNFRRRQLAVNNLLDKGLIQLNPETCPGLKRDLENVTQDQVTLGKEKQNPKLTHYSDGMDYFVDIEFPLSGSKPEHRSVKYR